MAIAVAMLALLTGCGEQRAPQQLSVAGSIGGRALADVTNARPMRIDPKADATLTLAMFNPSDATVSVERVRLEGEMLSLGFLTYDVRIRTVLAPGARRTLEVPLDFFDLERQASGYLRASVRLYDGQDRRLSDEAFAADIRGSAWSVMVLFALMLLAFTALSSMRNLRDIRRRLMPDVRHLRAVRMAVPGLGVGLLLSVGFSVLRIAPLPTVGWLVLTLVPTLAAAAIGYLLVPGPLADSDAPDPDEDDLEDDGLVDLTAERQVPVDR